MAVTAKGINRGLGQRWLILQQRRGFASKTDLEGAEVTCP